METLNRKIFANYRTALHSFGQIEPKGTLSFGHFPTKNSPFGERYFGKRQKIAAGYGRHTFDTKNIIDFLKYSERIDIG